ncbi:MAG TPA: hypothetical protein VEI02_08860, partial [Planctomycetota bacterium]|nr:hypothetical protein [Planctomycetota bacterium]
RRRRRRSPETEREIGDELLRRARGEVGWTALLALDALGRRGVASTAVVDYLLAAVRRDTTSRKFDLWRDARASFAWTALGRLRVSGARVLEAARPELAGTPARFRYSSALACLDEDVVLRAAMVAAPPPFSPLETRRTAGLRASPPWLADWAQRHPDRAVVDWAVPDAEGGFLIQIGEGGAENAWSPAKPYRCHTKLFVRLTRDDEGAIAVAVGEAKEAVAWILGPRNSPYLTRFFGEAQVSGAAGEAERLAIQLSVKANSRDAGEPVDRRRCAVEFPDPWRTRAVRK